MYNQEIKERFIEEREMHEATRRAVRGMFLRLESGEAYLQKDIAEMNKDEAYNVLAQMKSGFTNSYIYNMRSTLNAYIVWCLDNAVFPVVRDGILQNLRTESNGTIQDTKKYIRDENELIGSLRRIFIIQDGFIEPVLCALAWVGVTKDAMLLMTDDCVDLENRIITNEHGEIIVDGFSDLIYEVLEAYVSCQEGYRGNSSGGYTVYKDNSTGMFLKKFCVKTSKRMGEKYTKGQIEALLNAIKERQYSGDIAHKLNYESVRRSGMCYKLYQLEQTGFDPFLPENAEEVARLFGSYGVVSTVLKHYKTYKKAFNL